MNKLSVYAGGVILFGMLLFSLQCDRAVVGSVTETGNVTGKVLSTDSNKPVAGARIALFKKRSEIASADETFAPVEEIYSDSKGNFSLDIDDGKYTIVASGEEEYAFVDNVIPGTDDAKQMTIILEQPGRLKGEIVNSLELRGTGSVVTHLIGTDIYQNVDNNGRFDIENIPAGTYTLVSYSTYQPEFSPYYRKVTIYPDSVTDLSTFELKFNGIPIPKGIDIAYDTAHQVVKITWNSIGEYNDFQEYAILRGLAGQKKHDLEQIAYTKDTVYFDTINFTDSGEGSGTHIYEYAVQVNNKLGEIGQYYGIYEIATPSYETVIPKIENLDVTFDTLAGVVNVAWDSTGGGDDFSTVRIVRTIVRPTLYTPDSWEWNETTGNSLTGDSLWTIFDTIAIDTSEIEGSTTYIDSLYTSVLSVDSLAAYTIIYEVSVIHEGWELSGTVSRATIQVISFKALLPEIDAGVNQFADIGSEVELAGKVITAQWPIVKKEWKIGDGEWTSSDDGKMTFTTSVASEPETLICLFRVTDSVENVVTDSNRVVVSRLVTTYGTLPGMSQGTPTSFKFNDRFWTYNYIDNGKVAAWSSVDYKIWTVENMLTTIQNIETPILFKSKLFMLALDGSGSYKSENGKDWEAFSIVLDTNISNAFKQSDYIGYGQILVKQDTLLTLVLSVSGWNVSGVRLIYSVDGIFWEEYPTPLPVTEHNFESRLYVLHDTLYYVPKGVNKFKLTEGMGWEEAALWDEDYDLFPDEAVDMFAYDSGLVARFKEKPSNKVRIAISHRGVWTFVADDVVQKAKSPRDYEAPLTAWTYGNRFFWIGYNNNPVQSFKLY